MLKHLGEMVLFFELAPAVRFPLPFQHFWNRKLLARLERKVVTLTFASWNQIHGWLRRLEGLLGAV